jgi:transcriptional regulator with XRE-family HTH domain
MVQKARKQQTLREILAENVRAHRARRRFTQEKLAELSSSHQTYISAIEIGSSSASVDVIERIATALDVPAWKLLKPEGPEST